jgi:hypothetical protein
MNGPSHHGSSRGAMSNIQFSLRHLLVAVAFVAVGCTALLNANPWWVRGSWLATVGLLFVAVVQAIFRRGERRAFWTGFAIAGWLCIVAATNAFDGLRVVRQLPEQAMGALYARLPDALRMPYIEEQTGRPVDGGASLPPSVTSYRPSPEEPTSTGLVWLALQQQQPTFAPNPRHVGWEFFQSIGEAIWTLLVALVGGTIARWVYRSEQARSTAAS